MESQGWVFRVKAYPGESLGHFLGRFRRENQLSHKAIADHLGIRVEWVIALGKLVDLKPKQLAKMLSCEPLHLQTRLCAVC